MIAIPLYGSESVFELCDEASIIFADFCDEEGYGTLDLERWGCNPNIRQIVVSGWTVEMEPGDICENFEVDLRNEDQFRDAYAKAAELYNSFCPVNKKIPVIWDELKI